MPVKKPGLSEEERNLFTATVADAKPLRQKKKKGVVSPTTPEVAPAAADQSDHVPLKKTSTEKERSSITESKKAPPFDPAALHGVDRRTAERFRRGQMAIEARIDLHGETRAAAMQQVTLFLHQSFAAGRRCVLVITGKGDFGRRESSASQEKADRGVLRREFPIWLESDALRSIILGVAPAQPKDGGHGAFYVFLRRHR